MKHTTRAFFALFLLVVATAAWATGAAENAAGAQEVTIALGSDPATLDPHRSFNGFVFTVTNQVYETLIARDADGNLVPRLATAWRAVDETTLELEIREGVTFHDGTALDAEAVKFSLDRLRSPDTRAPGAFILSRVSQVEVVDEDTVRIVTDTPYAPLAANLAHPVTAIVSPAAVDTLGNEPVGTGPFAFERWVTGSRVELTAFDSYWGGRPTLDRVAFRVIPEAGTQVVELQAGTIDLASNVPPDRFESLAASESLVGEEFLGWGSTYLGFNLDSGPTSDVRVRRAIAHAIDREGMIETLRQGMARSADALVPPTVFGSDVDAETPEYAPAEARRLMQQTGLTSPVRLTLMTFDIAETRQIATAIQAELADLGMEVEVSITDYGAFARATSAGEHDLWLTTWGTVTLDADYTLYALLHSAQHDADNRSFYANDQVDEWLEAARATTDAAERRELYAQIQEQTIEDLPYLTLYYPLSNFVKNARLTGEVYGFSSISLDLREARIR